MRNRFIFYTPFTGLGLYNGYRGKRWLRNRIKIFKQFVIPALLNQTDRDFVHWISWRPEEATNPLVIELHKYLSSIPNYKFVFTYRGLCFWDDKYKDEEARERLAMALSFSLPQLFDYLPDCEEVYMMLQPSDDLYDKRTVEMVRRVFEDKKIKAASYTKGYICNYLTKQILEYNPNTNPPFYAIAFPRETFFDPGKHMTYTSLKKDVNQYKAGTPVPSHEYLPDCLPTMRINERGFLVGCHGENVSTHFNHPFGGRQVESELLDNFGILNVPKLELPNSFRKWIIRKLPFKWQKKLRYWWGERFYNWFYEFIRS